MGGREKEREGRGGRWRGSNRLQGSDERTTVDSANVAGGDDTTKWGLLFVFCCFVVVVLFWFFADD